jgi:hypothetical protein
MSGLNPELRSQQVRYQLSHLSQENVIVYFPWRMHRHSGIGLNPVPLLTY